MANDLRLYIPREADGWFYVKMLSDPATMSYNIPWFPPDGCIPNPQEKWAKIQKYWITKTPERFYAYLQRKSDGAFVGDVNYHRSAQDRWDIGIVIYAPERGRGYGKQGLRLLADRAFRVNVILSLHNEFETDRDVAYRIHKAVGFRDVGTTHSILHLELTQEDFQKQMDRKRRIENMKWTVKEIHDTEEKERIAKAVLYDLPEWFGLPESTEEYILESQKMPFLAVFVRDELAGFIVLHATSADCAEIFVMGIKKKFHRQGAGTKLHEAYEKLARKLGFTYSQVKTVQSGYYEEYDITNRFYRSVGYKELEVFPALWSEANPCQIYIKQLGESK